VQWQRAALDPDKMSSQTVLWDAHLVDIFLCGHVCCDVSIVQASDSCIALCSASAGG